MKDTSDMPERSEQPQEPPIIIVGIDRKSFYLYKGEEFINQLLLADGVYPKPVLCVNFDTVLDARRVIGDSFSTGSCWGINPEIIARMRDTKTLIEKDA